MFKMQNRFANSKLICSICKVHDPTLWMPPLEWTEPAAALYRSFDVPDGLTFMEGATEIDPIPLVCGKVRTFISGSKNFLERGQRHEI